MLETPISWGACPPAPNERRFVRICCPRTKAGVHALLIAPRVTGVWTHYCDNRTVPCAGLHCGICRDGHKPRWKGYIPCLEFPGRAVKLLEMTENAYQQLEALAKDRPTYRGLGVKVFRRHDRACAAMDVELVDHKYQHELPPPFDPVPILLRLWGIRVAVDYRAANGEAVNDVGEAIPTGEQEKPRPKRTRRKKP